MATELISIGLRSKIRIVLINGNGGASLEGIWFSYIRDQLRALGLNVVAQNLPDPLKGCARFWLPFLCDVIKPDENTLVIGHYSGGPAAMRYAEKHLLLGTVLIASHFDDCGFELERKSGFFDEPFDWEAIRQNQKFIIQFHSDDDPWITLTHAFELHHHLMTEFHEFKGEGHFGSYVRDKKQFPENWSVQYKALSYAIPLVFNRNYV